MNTRADVNKDLLKLKKDIDVFCNRNIQLKKVISNESKFYTKADAKATGSPHWQSGFIPIFFYFST